MESGERPAKMRKLQHSAGVESAPVADFTPASGSSQANETTAADEELPNDGAADQNNDAPKETADEELLNDSAADQNNESPKETVDGENGAPKLSKNQLKKQRRLERWEAGREDRKVKRREKIKAKKERRREEWAPGDDTAKSRPSRNPEGTQVPITIVFDCDFEDLMFENELKSLGLQITRCYSDNRKSPFHAHLAVSSFGGKLKERFDGILAKQYTSWKGVRFFSEDFVHVAEQSKEWMKGKDGGTIAGALDQGADSNSEEGEVVYLSAESDVTLDRLKPNSTYIIGGLVDKNRHKGVCYRRAMNRGIKTAKLPIGEFLQMKSRQVLVTNHVLEIMLKWMECGDWGKAFMEVIPKRKGGVLKSELEEDDEAESGAGDVADVNSQTERDDGQEPSQPKDLKETATPAATEEPV